MRRLPGGRNWALFPTEILLSQRIEETACNLVNYVTWLWYRYSVYNKTHRWQESLATSEYYSATVLMCNAIVLKCDSA